MYLYGTFGSEYLSAYVALYCQRAGKTRTTFGQTEKFDHMHVLFRLDTYRVPIGPMFKICFHHTSKRQYYFSI